MAYFSKFGERLSGEKLTKFIDKSINPDSQYKLTSGKCTDNIVKFMKTVTPYNIASVIKGGSLGKGTALKNNSDLDILFVFNDVKSIKELTKKLKQIKHELHNALCCGSFSFANVTLSKEQKAKRRRLKKNRPFKVSDIKRTPFTVSFNMTYPDGTKFPVDLLIIPNITAIPGRFTSDELKHIYNEMKNNPSERDFYGKCLSPLQVKFVKEQPEKVKRAIRVIKDWTKQHGHKLPSYATELLVIKSYEDFNRPQPGGITEEKLVISVFDRLRDCSNIRIHWDTNYNLMDHQQPSPPYIMDPANPYHNLFSKNTEEYWIRQNETENIILSDPDFSRLELDAARTMESFQI